MIFANVFQTCFPEIFVFMAKTYTKDCTSLNPVLDHKASKVIYLCKQNFRPSRSKNQSVNYFKRPNVSYDYLSLFTSLLCTSSFNHFAPDSHCNMSTNSAPLLCSGWLWKALSRKERTNRLIYNVSTSTMHFLGAPLPFRLFCGHVNARSVAFSLLVAFAVVALATAGVCNMNNKASSDFWHLSKHDSILSTGFAQTLQGTLYTCTCKWPRCAQTGNMRHGSIVVLKLKKNEAVLNQTW